MVKGTLNIQAHKRVIKHHLWTIFLMNQKSQPQWQWPPSSPQWQSKEWHPISIGVNVQLSCTTISASESLEIDVDQIPTWPLGPRLGYHQWVITTSESTYTNSIDNSTHLVLPSVCLIINKIYIWNTYSKADQYVTLHCFTLHVTLDARNLTWWTPNTRKWIHCCTRHWLQIGVDCAKFNNIDAL